MCCRKMDLASLHRTDRKGRKLIVCQALGTMLLNLSTTRSLIKVLLKHYFCLLDEFKLSLREVNNLP